MHISHGFDAEQAMVVGWGVRALVLAAEVEGPLTRRLAGLGCAVEVAGEMYEGLAALLDDPAGYGLVVIDCDAFAGEDAAERVRRTILGAGLHVPLLLVGSRFQRQDFPEDRDRPTCLRAPVSAVALRVGFEHAMRDRLLWGAA
jgi:hypothetical protein